MQNILEEIVTHKKREIAKLPAFEKQVVDRKRRFYDALQKKAVIAEIKRRSPSAGNINEIKNPHELAKEYEGAGADVISVLTDHYFFGGSAEDLKLVAKTVSIPILRKDFIVHPKQIYESVSLGASGVLLMVSVLGDSLKEYLDLCHEIGMGAIVEVHNENELTIALKAKASCIGINHRDLKTFHMHMNRSFELRPKIPDSILVVGESGVRSSADGLQLLHHGMNAILIGEALVRSTKRKQFITSLKRPGVKICGVSEEEQIAEIAELGADFLGLVIDPTADRKVPQNALLSMIERCKQCGIEPVLVARNLNLNEFSAFVDIANSFQLYGDLRLTLPNLSKSCFFAVSNEEELQSAERFMRMQKDYLLVESTSPGTGKEFNPMLVQKVKDKPFFLAGGINEKNIEKILETFNPCGVDVSSGVEGGKKGIKDLKKVNQLISVVKKW